MIRSLLLLILLLPLPLWAQTSPLAPHTAEYQVNYGEINLGGARFMLLPPEGDFYQYKLDSDLSLLVLSDKRHIRSEFTYQDGQLTPLRFSHQRTGTGPNFNEQIAFAKEQGKIFSRYKDEKSKLDYSGTLYDALMVQLQFRLDLAAGKEPLAYELVKDNEIDDYRFKIVGKERMTLDSGVYNTVKLEVVRDSTKRQTFVWMAPDLGWLPMRLTHFESGSKQLDIKLAKLSLGSEVNNQLAKTE